nr:hypothetical protein DBT45_09695 [Aerococcus tenax]
MTLNAARYCLRQVAILFFVALIPAVFTGVVKFAVELAYGHPAWIALGPALVFFVGMYLFIAIGSSVATLVIVLKKLQQAGFSLDYLGGLQKDERQKFEREHGI